MPGIAGLAVMSTTFSALAMNLVFLREQGVLKRMRGTPLPTPAYLAGVFGNAVTNAVIQISIVVLAGKLLFGIGWPKDWIELAVFVTAGVVCLAALGIAWAHVIPNFDAAPAYVNIVFLPVIFISGVFYDVGNAPQFLRDIAQALPLTHVIDGLSGAMVTGTGLADHLSDLLVIGLWAALGIVFAVRGFSWEPAPGLNASGGAPSTLTGIRASSPRAHSSRSSPKTLTSRWRSPWRCQPRSTPSWRRPTPSSARVDRTFSGLEYEPMRCRPSTANPRWKTSALDSRLAPVPQKRRPNHVPTVARRSRAACSASPVMPAGPCSRWTTSRSSCSPRSARAAAAST